jgi:hypothetical protein
MLLDLSLCHTTLTSPLLSPNPPMFPDKTPNTRARLQQRGPPPPPPPFVHHSVFLSKLCNRFSPTPHCDSLKHSPKPQFPPFCQAKQSSPRLSTAQVSTPLPLTTLSPIFSRVQHPPPPSLLTVLKLQQPRSRRWLPIGPPLPQQRSVHTPTSPLLYLQLQLPTSYTQARPPSAARLPPPPPPPLLVTTSPPPHLSLTKLGVAGQVHHP